MQAILTILLLFFVGGLVIGLFKPEMLIPKKKKGTATVPTRKQVLLRFGLPAMFLLVVVAAMSGEGDAQPTNTVNQDASNVSSDTAQKVDAKVEPQYQEVFTFSGEGIKKSEPFTVTGNRFKIEYDCTGDLCQAFLQKADGGLEGVIMNTTGATKDETIQYGSGEYYIEANTIGKYTFKVYDYK